MIGFNSRDTEYKKPFGAVKVGEKVNITFPVRKSIRAKAVVLVYRDNFGSGDVQKLLKKTAEDGDFDVFTLSFSYAKEGVYWYRFEVKTEDDTTLYVGRDGRGHAIIGEWLPEWQQTVYKKNFKTPEYLKGGVIYQIFPDRFKKEGKSADPKYGVKKEWHEPLTLVDPDGVYRANDFYGGNVKGVMSKLDYLADLGVTAIYFNPIFLSYSNHRYDTANYMKIDPVFGTEEEFAELIKKAEKKGISIILDGVFNHTGADSIYFNRYKHFPTLGAYQGKNSKYYDWFTFQRFPDEYTCWWGCTNVPTVRRDAEGYRNLIAGEGGVIEKWTKMGVKGWRLDVVDELSDDFVVRIRERLKSIDPNAVLIGEVWEDASTKESYSEKRNYLFGDELDGVMNYPYKNAVLSLIATGNMDAFIENVMTIAENYPKEVLDCSMTLIGTHDTVRAMNALGNITGAEFISKADKQNFRMSGDLYCFARDRLMAGSAVQFFLPGVPTIYYGDEIGMQGFEDPLNREPMPEQGDDMILNHYKTLGAVRKKYRKDFAGGFEIIKHFGYLEIKRGRVALLINVGRETARFGEERKEFVSGSFISELAPMRTAIVIETENQGE